MQNNSYGYAVSVRVGGKEHRHWERYDIDSDFLIPADSFDFVIGRLGPEAAIPDLSGESCEVVIDGQIVMTGIIGSQRHGKSKGSRELSLSGRDLAGFLVDCSAPQLNVKGMTVLDAAKKLAAPWPQIKAVVLKAENNPALDKIDIEPGETVWQALTHIANSVGLHPWLEPDGTLVVGGADYSSPPVATLCWSRTDSRCNIERMDIEWDTDNRFSEVTFLAQSHGRSGDSAKHDLKWVYKDPTIACACDRRRARYRCGVFSDGAAVYAIPHGWHANRAAAQRGRYLDTRRLPQKGRGGAQAQRQTQRREP